MNIGILYSDTKNYNGIREYASNLYYGLQNKVDVKMLPIKKLEVKIGNKKIGGFISSEIYQYIKKLGKGYDITHATSHWIINNYTNVATVHDIFKISMPIVFRISNVEKNYYLKYFKKLEDMKAIFVLSNYVKKDLSHYVKNTNIFSIPMGTPIDYQKNFIEQDLGIKLENPFTNNKLHLVTMGEIHKSNNRKKIWELYDFVKDLPDVELYHIGYVTDEFKNYAKNIIQLGFVGTIQKIEYLMYADKFVFDTYAEGQGIPVMEAMKLNTQVIINDIPIHRELLEDKPYYFHNKDEFIDLIYKDKKQGLIEQIKKYDNWINEYLKIYEAIV